MEQVSAAELPLELPSVTAEQMKTAERTEMAGQPKTELIPEQVSTRVEPLMALEAELASVTPEQTKTAGQPKTEPSP